MAWCRQPALVMCVACLTGMATAQDPPMLINMNNPDLTWRSHRNPDTTCVLRGTAVSEMRDDAFEVQFRHARGQQLKLFVLIPRLPKGGTVFMDAPTTRDRVRIFTDNYVPALTGEQAANLRRNVAAGIPLHFTFEYSKGKPVKYETVPTGAVIAAAAFASCVDENAQEALKAERK